MTFNITYPTLLLNRSCCDQASNLPALHCALWAAVSTFPFSFAQLSFNFRCNYAFCKTKSLKQNGARAYHWKHQLEKAVKGERTEEGHESGEKYVRVFYANWFNFLWPLLVNFIFVCLSMSMWMFYLLLFFFFLLFLWLLMLSLLLLLPQFLFLFRFVFICFCFTFMASSCSRAEHALPPCPAVSVCLGGGSVNIIARTEISCSVQLRQLKHFLCSFMVYLP